MGSPANGKADQQRGDENRDHRPVSDVFCVGNTHPQMLTQFFIAANAFLANIHLWGRIDVFLRFERVDFIA